jgi:hypothetical protein
MKKIQLTIPKPCHEDWNSMTTEQKGRFCSSCQKTVIDFSNMSDRQVAEFFKKPPGNICGRLHNDQLNRPITVSHQSKSRISHFFKCTVPAFLLMLKSCTVKNETSVKLNENNSNNTLTISNKIIGKLSINGNNIVYETINLETTMGIILPEIPSIDTNNITGDVQVFSSEKDKEHCQTKNELVSIMGEIAAEVIDRDQNGKIVPTDTLHFKDTVLTNEPYTKGDIKVLEEAYIDNSKNLNSETTEFDFNNSHQNRELDFIAYPNPVKRGGVLNISIPATFNSYSLQLFSSTGQLVVQRQVNKNQSLLSFTLPQTVPGMYFIRMIDENKTSVKAIQILIRE